MTSTVLSSKDEVNVYDSVYRAIDRTTRNIISNLSQTSSWLRATGGKDCGMYAIAISTALAFCHDPSVIRFDQQARRPHLVACFEKETFSQFLTVYLCTHMYAHATIHRVMHNKPSSCVYTCTII